MKLRYLAALAISSCIYTGAFAQGGAADALSSLAGPGESVTLTAKRHTTRSNAKNEMVSLVSEENVRLKSSKLNLTADRLEYNAVLGILEAKGNVNIVRPDVTASAEHLTYDPKTETITMTGNPKVRQVTPENTANFDGMDEMVIKTSETGEREIRMQGGQEVKCEIKPAAVPASPLPTPAAPKTTSMAKKSSGFAGMGNDVSIRTRPRPNQPASVLLNSGADGTMGLFRAVGSVIMNSEKMNLRSDFLEYDGAKDTVEALYNVYIKQDTVEADCGRMFYQVPDGIITLSINPRVRQEKPDSVMRISELDKFIITQYPDGTSTTESVGTGGGEPAYVIEPKNVAETPKPKATEAREIDVNNPNEFLQSQVK